MQILPPSPPASPNVLPALSRCLCLFHWEDSTHCSPSYPPLALQAPSPPSASLPLPRDSTSQLSSSPALSLLFIVSGLFPPQTTYMASLFSPSSFLLTKNDWEGNLGTLLKNLSSIVSPPQNILDYLQPAHSGCSFNILPIIFSFILVPWPHSHPSLPRFSMSVHVFFLLLSVGPSHASLPVYLSASLPQGPACLALPTETTLSSASILAPWR